MNSEELSLASGIQINPSPTSPQKKGVKAAGKMMFMGGRMFLMF